MTRSMGRPQGPWVVRTRAVPGPRARLFCFPYAGGAAGVFRSWAELLPRELDVCAIQPPGRGARFREPAFTRLADLVDALEEALGPELDRPFAFYGHSMGGLVCFELAKRLEERGGPAPGHVTLSGCRPPHLPPRDPPIGHLPDAEFLAEVRDRFQGIPREVLDEPELVELLLPAMRADFQVLETHPRGESAPLGCPLLCVGGEQDARVDRPDLEAWSGYTRASFTVQSFPGGHFFIDDDRAALLSLLGQELRRWLLAPAAGGGDRTQAV